MATLQTKSSTVPRTKKRATLHTVTASNDPNRPAGRTYFMTSTGGSGRASNWTGSNVRTQYHSLSTGGRVSKSGARLKGASSPLAKKIGAATPQGRAAKAGSMALTKFHPPRSDKRTESPIKFGNHTPALLAEYLVALALIGWSGTTKIANNGYQHAISGIMLRFTAVTMVWFVLFLMAAGKRSGTFAAWFGALIDLGILFDAVNSQSVANLTSVIKGQGLNMDKTTLTDSLKPTEYYMTQGQDVTNG